MSDKINLIDKIRNRLNENAGKEIAKTFGAEEDLLQVKSWIPLKPFFKQATGGEGIPVGHITILIGKPDSGKTSLAMEAMVSCQKIGGVVYLIDSEHKFSLSRFELMGGNPKEIVIVQTETLEDAWTNIDNVLKEIQTLRNENINVPMLIVWDSIAASVPDSIMESEAGDAHVAVEAKINNKNVRKLRQAIKKSNTAFIGINHYYMTQPKTRYEQPELIIKGGEELTFLSTLIIRTKQGAQLTRTIKGEEQKYGRTTKFFIHKGHFHGRTINKDVFVVDKGILENNEELEIYKKSLRGEF